MTPEDLRRLMDYLQERVQPTDDGGVTFDLPDAASMEAAGQHPDGVAQLLAAPWLEEMCEEVRETPEFCAPDDTPEQVLQYARDVVEEYLRKRFQL